MSLSTQLSIEHDRLQTSNIYIYEISTVNLPACDTLMLVDRKFIIKMRRSRNLTSGNNSRPNAPEALPSSDIKGLDTSKDVVFLVLASWSLVGGHESFASIFKVH